MAFVKITRPISNCTYPVMTLFLIGDGRQACVRLSSGCRDHALKLGFCALDSEYDPDRGECRFVAGTEISTARKQVQSGMTGTFLLRRGWRRGRYTARLMPDGVYVSQSDRIDKEGT